MCAHGHTGNKLVERLGRLVQTARASIVNYGRLQNNDEMIDGCHRRGHYRLGRRHLRRVDLHFLGGIISTKQRLMSTEIPNLTLRLTCLTASP
jgi:hypothetical protein